MKQVVADASFCGAWILADEFSEEADRLLSQLVKGTVQLAVPALWHYEMMNLLRSALRRKRLAPEDVSEAIDALEQVPILLEDLPGGPARRRMFHLTVQFDLPAYDAAYLELADRLKIRLVTCEAKLNAAAKQLGLC